MGKLNIGDRVKHSAAFLKSIQADSSIKGMRGVVVSVTPKQGEIPERCKVQWDYSREEAKGIFTKYLSKD